MMLVLLAFTHTQLSFPFSVFTFEFQSLFITSSWNRVIWQMNESDDSVKQQTHQSTQYLVYPNRIKISCLHRICCHSWFVFYFCCLSRFFILTHRNSSSSSCALLCNPLHMRGWIRNHVANVCLFYLSPSPSSIRCYSYFQRFLRKKILHT